MSTKQMEVSGVLYSGSLEELPALASPGLLFIKAWIASADSLCHDDSEAVKRMSAPDAIVIYNGEPRKALYAKDVRDIVQRKRAKRIDALKSIEQEFDRAWDLDNGDGTRTVVSHTRNIFYFKADPENPLVMPEACTVALERAPDLKDGDAETSSQTTTSLGVAGFWASEFRSWHDRVLMLKKREELGC